MVAVDTADTEDGVYDGAYNDDERLVEYCVDDEDTKLSDVRRRFIDVDADADAEGDTTDTIDDRLDCVLSENR